MSASKLPECVYTAHDDGKAVVAVNGPFLKVFGIDRFSHQRIANLVRKRLAALDPGAVIVPVRQGFPLLTARIAVKLGIPLVFTDLVLTKRGKVERKGTDLRRWDPDNRALFKKLARKADAVVKFRGNSYEYNAYLADASTVLFCAYDAGLEDHMLAHLVAYSDQMGLQVENLLPLWETMERARKYASETPIRLVSSKAKLPKGVKVLEIDSGPLANPFGDEQVDQYEKLMQERLADKKSEFRTTLLEAWRDAKAGRQVCLVTSDPQSASHGRVLLGFLQSHLAPRSS